MKKNSAVFLFSLFLTFSIFAQQPGWNVNLQPNTSARSNVEVINQCQRTHNFKVEFPNVPFLQPTAPTELQVKGGKSVQLPVVFNTNGMAVGTYQGEVLVICQTCKKEPTCTQDREKLPVILTVGNPNPPTSTSPTNQTNPTTSTTPTIKPTSDKSDKKGDAPTVSDNPCDKLKRECGDLQRIAAEKEAAAAAAQSNADKLKKQAEEAEKKAKETEEAAKKAAEMAQPAPTGGTISADGNTFSQADNAALEAKKKKLFDDWKAGKITAEEYQHKQKELSGPEALKKAQAERLANEAKLKKEAEEAKQKAEAERKAADEAKRAADEAQKTADKAKKEADEARKKAEDCLKNAAEECARWEKEKREKAEAERKAAETAAQKKRDEEARQKAEEDAKAKQLAHQKYLIDNIKQLGLISSKKFTEVPGIWDWLPAILEKPVGDLLEEAGKTPIPTDVIKAIGGLYNVLASLLDPCTQAGKRKTVERLQKMINPKTNAKYTLDEALQKTEDMCKLLKELKSKVEQLKKAQG
jgi:hypothetical protein